MGFSSQAPMNFLSLENKVLLRIFLEYQIRLEDFGVYLV